MKRKQKSGWVYVMRSYDHPRWHKVGKTTRNPTSRGVELNERRYCLRECSCSGRWQHIHKVATHDCHEVERLAHKVLFDRRVDYGREIFDEDAETCLAVVKAAAKEINSFGYRFGPFLRAAPYAIAVVLAVAFLARITPPHPFAALPTYIGRPAR